MNTNLVADTTSSAPANAPTWVLVVGASVGLLAILFLMYLVVSGQSLDRTRRGLIAIITSFAAAFAFAFVGGYAKAHGTIPITANVTPVQFGIGGGIAVLVIVYLILHHTLVKESGPSRVNDGAVSINVQPDTTLREAIEAAANAAGKSVIFVPESSTLDTLIVKPGELMDKPVEKLIELIALRLANGGSIRYQVEPRANSNVIEIKIATS
jgi:hypothetical protein